MGFGDKNCLLKLFYFETISDNQIQPFGNKNSSDLTLKIEVQLKSLFGMELFERESKININCFVAHLFIEMQGIGYRLWAQCLAHRL